ncbi:hypothetical protein GCM10025789_11910 [Tessaracoccus lubricantis]|uniref:Uncharacterized protein n=1 Tax=Tessaracoccus lubricantis TaxID=545543 RepID=A0ABP9F8M9_9ACTN
MLVTASAMDVAFGLVERVPPYGREAWRVCRMPCWTHSGHWNPTEPGIMHWGQMGRPHRWHEIRVGSFGCR